jgi:hypothetical protein
MSSLVQLAENKTLPDHQFMDVETLDWIKKNYPFAEIEGLGEPFPYADAFGILDKFRIDQSWFSCKEEIDSIHGIRHILRVAVNGLNLLQYGFKEEQYKNTVLVAALCHDLKRENDKSDPDHGKRSAVWFKNNLQLVEKTFVKLEDQEVDDVFYSIYYHDTDMSELVNLPEYKSHKRAVDILKIADSLDRYRLPKLKWWVNDELLPSAPPTSAKRFAYKLVVESEKNYLKSDNSYNSVLSVIEKYATIKKT